MKQFTLLQLFALIDGRLTTPMDDVYDMLNHITGEDLMTHHLPTALKFIKNVSPDWWGVVAADIAAINANLSVKYAKVTFNQIYEKLKESNKTYDIPTLTTEQKVGFEDFMVNNSLLIRK